MELYKLRIIRIIVYTILLLVTIGIIIGIYKMYIGGYTKKEAENLEYVQPIQKQSTYMGNVALQEENPSQIIVSEVTQSAVVKSKQDIENEAEKEKRKRMGEEHKKVIEDSKATEIKLDGIEEQAKAK